MSQLVRKEYQCDPSLLAQWVDQRSGTWWFVDGDPYLTRRLDFPCPAEELSDVLKSERMPIFVISERDLPDMSSVQTVAQCNILADRVDPDDLSSDRLLLCRWEGSADEWLLIEDQAAAGSLGTPQNDESE